MCEVVTNCEHQVNLWLLIYALHVASHDPGLQDENLGQYELHPVSTLLILKAFCSDS